MICSTKKLICLPRIIMPLDLMRMYQQSTQSLIIVGERVSVSLYCIGYSAFKLTSASEKDNTDLGRDDFEYYVSSNCSTNSNKPMLILDPG